MHARPADAQHADRFALVGVSAQVTTDPHAVGAAAERTICSGEIVVWFGEVSAASGDLRPTLQQEPPWRLPVPWAQGVEGEPTCVACCAGRLLFHRATAAAADGGSGGGHGWIGCDVRSGAFAPLPLDESVASANVACAALRAHFERGRP